MKQFEVGFSYTVEEFGVVNLDAIDKFNEEEAYDMLRDMYPDALDIEIDYIKEIK